MGRSTGGKARTHSRKRKAVKRLTFKKLQSWFRKHARRSLAFFAFFLLFLFLLPFILVPVYRFIDPPSTLMLGRYLTFQTVQQSPVPLNAVSAHVISAVIASEDQRFCAHNGIDWDALSTQASAALSGEETRGASTITMQTVKNLFLWTDRSYIRKIIEIPLSLWMDFVLPKRRILELYLNVAEWGDGIFGIEAAANAYFKRSASRLNRVQAARLATSLPNPLLRNPARPSRGHKRLSRLSVARSSQIGPYLSCLVPTS